MSKKRIKTGKVGVFHVQAPASQLSEDVYDWLEVFFFGRNNSL